MNWLSTMGRPSDCHFRPCSRIAVTPELREPACNRCHSSRSCSLISLLANFPPGGEHATGAGTKARELDVRSALWLEFHLRGAHVMSRNRVKW